MPRSGAERGDAVILDDIENAWRKFVRESNGRIPTCLLCSPLEEIALRDALLQHKRIFGLAYAAADGMLRVKNALVISHPYIDKLTFVWQPGETK